MKHPVSIVYRVKWHIILIKRREVKHPISIVYRVKWQLPAFSLAERTYYAVPELQLGKH